MFQYFPKINYRFGGLTLETTDIFRQVNVIYDKPDAISTSTLLPGERPEQASNRLYRTPDFYWSLFLTNGVRNPFTDWAQTQESYVKNIESQYSGWEYQFANISEFIPPSGSTGFTGMGLSRYTGVNLEGILPGDLIIYETGSGPYSIKCYGVGGVTSFNNCGSPHYGQSIIPENFDVQQNVVQVAAGNYFNASLDNNGYIYVWGQNFNPGTAFTKTGTLFKSRTGAYTFIEASGNRLVAINSQGALECFGACTDFNQFYTGTTNLVKTRWTAGVCGGIGIKSDFSVVSYGITAPPQLYDADCGFKYCLGIMDGSYGKRSYGVTAFGANPGFNLFTTVPGITGITLISTRHNHALALTYDGRVLAWGSNTEGQTDVPSDSFINISAGVDHSAAINTKNELITWGKFLIYGENGCAGQSQTKIFPSVLDGQFGLMASGLHHIILKGTGTNKKYIGIVDSVDTIFKRIFVNTTQFAESEPLFLSPAGTVVSVWRYNPTEDTYNEVKVIQNQLISIQRYLDSTKYIEQAGNIIDCSNSSNWESIYIPNYITAADNPEFITFRKELMDVDLINKTKINQFNASQISKVESAIQQLFAPDSTINEIRISEL